MTCSGDGGLGEMIAMLSCVQTAVLYMFMRGFWEEGAKPLLILITIFSVPVYLGVL